MLAGKTAVTQTLTCVAYTPYQWENHHYSHHRAIPSNPRKSCQKEEKIPWLSHVQANDPWLHEAKVGDSNALGPACDIIALKKKAAQKYQHRRWKETPVSQN